MKQTKATRTCTKNTGQPRNRRNTTDIREKEYEVKSMRTDTRRQALEGKNETTTRGDTFVNKHKRTSIKKT